MNEKAAIENEALAAAFMKSSKSLEEAIAFFEAETVEKDEELKMLASSAKMPSGGTGDQRGPYA